MTLLLTTFLLQTTDASTTQSILQLTGTTNGTNIHYNIGQASGDFACNTAGTQNIIVNFEANITMTDCRQYLVCEDPAINYNELSSALYNSTLFTTLNECLSSRGNLTSALYAKDLEIQDKSLNAKNWMEQTTQAKTDLVNAEKANTVYLIGILLLIVGLILSVFRTPLLAFMQKNEEYK